MKDFTTEASRNGSTSMSSKRVIPPTASFVCRVLKTRWPVMAARIAMSAVSTSRISPTITTFGSCRKMWRKPRANVKSISGFTSICKTPGSLIFNRFLDRDNAARDRVDGAEEAIKRCRFSAPGRAGEQDDSIGLGQEMANHRLLLLAEIETLKTELLSAAGEQTQTDRFAVHRRNGRDADIDFLIVRVQIHPAILGQTPLGDVHVRHHF